MTKRKKLSKEDREKLYNEYDGYCAYCGEKIDIGDMQVDHIIPLKKGGEDELWNMICSCRSCNHYKSTLTLEQFREQLKQIPQRLIRDSATFRIALRFGLVKIKEGSPIFCFEELRHIDTSYAKANKYKYLETIKCDDLTEEEIAEIIYKSLCHVFNGEGD